MTHSERAPDRPAWPPERSRRIESKKVRYTNSWMYFGLFLCIFVAWWFPVRMVVRHFMYPPVRPEAPRNARAFAALAYTGVSNNPNEVSPARFDEHLKALIRQGYVPLTLRDVHRFYADGELLPDKGILLTFDHGRRTSYFNCRTPISRAGWNAVMFLWVRPMEEYDDFVLRWPYVKSMHRSATWEIGAQSYDGFERIRATAGGRLGNFMTTVQWLDEEERFERVEEFHERLARDHDRCIRKIETKGGVTPRAYAYPYGDFGQYKPKAYVARRINTEMVRKRYGLGFASGGFAMNTSYSNPQRLNRLQVSPEWTGEELVAFLERAWPEASPDIGMQETREPSGWIVDWGEMSPSAGGLVLSAKPETTGAKMWLAGSELSRDASARVRFSLPRGQMGLYVRATPDEESFVYVGVDVRGDVLLREKAFGHDLDVEEEELEDKADIWLRQSFAGQERFTLSSAKVWLEPGREHVLDISVRGQLLFATLDGRQLFRTRMTSLRGLPRAGMLGISIWDPEPGAASVEILGVALHELAPNIASWPFTDYNEAKLVQWIHEHSASLSAISPPWLRITPLGEIHAPEWDEKLFRMLARTYDLKLIPELLLQEETGIYEFKPEELADRVATSEFDGLVFNLNTIPTMSMAALTAWLRQCHAAFDSKGLLLRVHLPGEMETATGVQSMLTIIPGLALVSKPESGLAANAAVLRDTTVLEKQVIGNPRPGETDAPFYYELEAISMLSEEPDDQIRLSRLMQDGQSAYNAGNFERAIALWEACREIEPDNPRVLRLIGDAWQSLGNTIKALDFYEQSLEVNPAQLALAILRARILVALGRSEEAREALNLYSRLFPENTDILLAQAEWLNMHDRREDSRNLVRKVLELDPENINALIFLHQLLDRPAERYANMRRLLAVGSREVFQLEFGKALLRHNLLGLPESYQLRNYIERVAAVADSEDLRELYRKMLPVSSPVSESFEDGTLSSAWEPIGGHYVGDSAWIRAATFPGRTEVNLRLHGSDAMRNGFLEVEVEEFVGMFWLCARRTEDHMLRLGFDQYADRIQIQVWRHGHLVDRLHRPWKKPDRPVRLRLEVRGDGAMGYLDGQPAFGAPIQLPFEMAGGYWSVSLYDPMPGAAKATIWCLSAGPLPVHIASLPAEVGEDKPELLLRELRDMPHDFSIMAPRWFLQDHDGGLIRRNSEDERLVRIFALYHRMRILPVIEMRTPKISSGLLVETARASNVRGFILLFNDMPPAAWFAQLERELEPSPLDIVAVVLDRGKRVAHARNVRLGYGIFPESEHARTMQLLYGADDALEEASEDDDLLLWF